MFFRKQYRVQLKQKSHPSRVALFLNHKLTVECFRPLYTRVLYTANVANQYNLVCSSQ